MTSSQVADSPLASRLEQVEQRIVEACLKSGRPRSEVTLIPVSKRQPLAKLNEALDAGVRCFGESQVQEAEAKAAELPADLDWHFIGHLQSNKTRPAVRLFDTIHSINRLKIAHCVEQEARQQGRRIRGFLQVNIGNEATKHGFDAADFIDTAQTLGDLEHLEIVGLMALPPFEDDPERTRRWFRQLRDLRDELSVRCPWPHFKGLLSMGMSHDLEAAIAEGSTHIRIGTSIFGSRPA